MGSSLEISVMVIDHLADRGVVKTQAPRDLGESIAVVEVGPADRAVARALVPESVLGEEDLEAGSRGEALAPRDFREGCGRLESACRLLNERLRSQQDLAGEPVPGGWQPHAFLDKPAVGGLGVGAGLGELAQYPVTGKKFLWFGAPGRGAVARPGVVLGVFDHPGAHGIEHDVAGQFHKVAVLVHEDRLEPSLQQMPDPLVAAVEGLGIDAV